MLVPFLNHSFGSLSRQKNTTAISYNNYHLTVLNGSTKTLEAYLKENGRHYDIILKHENSDPVVLATGPHFDMQTHLDSLATSLKPEKTTAAWLSHCVITLGSIGLICATIFALGSHHVSSKSQTDDKLMQTLVSKMNDTSSLVPPTMPKPSSAIKSLPVNDGGTLTPEKERERLISIHNILRDHVLLTQKQQEDVTAGLPPYMKDRIMTFFQQEHDSQHAATSDDHYGISNTPSAPTGDIHLPNVGGGQGIETPKDLNSFGIHNP